MEKAQPKKEAEKLFFPGTDLGYKEIKDKNVVKEKWWVYPQDLGSPWKAAMIVMATSDEEFNKQAYPAETATASLNTAYDLLKDAQITGYVQGLGGYGAPSSTATTGGKLAGASEEDKNLVVFGVSGKIKRRAHVDEWESFTLRWDWDQIKGVHVNLMVGPQGYAFMEATKNTLQDGGFWSRRDAPPSAYQERLKTMTDESGYSKPDFEANKADREQYSKKIGENLRDSWLRKRSA